MVRDGYFYGIALFAVAGLLRYFSGDWVWSIIPILLALFFLWFFRDPEREIPDGEGLVISPADGKVTEAVRVVTPDGEALRLSIFLNVFNVHVNRSPITGTLREVAYRNGKYLNAMNPASAEQNEQNKAVIEADEGYFVSFTQIAGLLARRIVFRHKEGDRLERGQRVGLIKFGSRVDVMLPGHAELHVKKGDHVKGGSSILATVPEFPVLPEFEEVLAEPVA
ncbi:MAG TPA: phosphatidylserine decarboxylase family protein [Acidobacteriaceae bacterium]|nr:phosphatidylserine decarboxylase family protein [Acidobacteriaceae bacterium]